MKNATLPKTIAIPYFPGTNCEVESMEAVKLTGKAKPVLWFINDILAGKIRPTDCDLMWLVGGFSYGDDPGTGVVAGTLIKEFLQEVREASIPMLMVCNGFQTGVRAGIFGGNVTLTENDSGVFCSRPSQLLIINDDCVWTKDMAGEVISCPAAHHGGKVVKKGKINVVAAYYDESPNGSNIAGIRTPDGLVYGQMNHLERRYDNPHGQKILLNGIRAV